MGIKGLDRMDRYKSVDNRDQMNLMPMCMDDMISPNSEARAIDAVVDKMDIPSKRNRQKAI